MNEPDSRPALCIALDVLLSEQEGLTNATVAKALEVDSSTVARWRNNVAPDPHSIRRVELYLEVPVGTVFRLCDPPLVEDPEQRTVLQMLENDPQLTDSHRVVISAAYKAALKGSRDERKLRAEWNKTTRRR